MRTPRIFQSERAGVKPEGDAPADTERRGSGAESGGRLPLLGLRAATVGRSGAEGVSIDRETIRTMVEDGWRGLLALDAADVHTLAAAVERQNAQFEAIAGMLPTEAQRDAFMRVMVEERQVLLNEQKRNPKRLRRRLGLAPAKAPTGEGLGSVAVKSAIQATIWAAVTALLFGRWL